jgi:hypothetical protein
MNLEKRTWVVPCAFISTLTDTRSSRWGSACIRLSHDEILATLGAGGMAIVYRARAAHARSDRPSLRPAR